MARIKEEEAKKYLKQFRKFDGNLKEFCESKEPALPYSGMRKWSSRLKKKSQKSDKSGNSQKAKQKVKEKKVTTKDKKTTTKGNTATTGNVKVTKRKFTKRKGKDQSQLISLELPDTETATVEIIENGKVTELISVTMPIEGTFKHEHQLFCRKYINEDMSATQAYMEVYGVEKPTVASACACRLLKNDNVRDYVFYLRCIKAAYTQKRIETINETRKVFTETSIFDFGEVVDNKLIIANSKTFDPEKAQAIKTLTTKRKIRYEKGSNRWESDHEVMEEEIKIELYDKLKALSDEEASRRKPRTSNTIFDGPEQKELWNRFMNKDLPDSLTGDDLALTMDSQGVKIPQSIELHEKKEIALIETKKGRHDPDEWSYESIEKKLNKIYEDDKVEFESGHDAFIEKRQGDVKKLIKKHGFDELSKPVDKIIDNNNITDPD